MYTLGTFWKYGTKTGILVAVQQQDDGTFLGNVAGAGWRPLVAGVPWEADEAGKPVAPWTQVHADGSSMDPVPALPIGGV